MLSRWNIHRPLSPPHILLPKRWMSTDYLSRESRTRSFFFLAGPVRGSGVWHRRMFRALQNQKGLEGFVAAVPCRWDETHSLARYFLDGHNCWFNRQLDWEIHHMELAGLAPQLPIPELVAHGIHPAPAIRGCIIFWLGCESELNPHPGPEPFSMDTRGEIARWSMRKKFEPGVRMVVGADSRFHGLSQIQRNTNKDLGYEFPVYTTIQETARAAARLALLA